MFRTKSFTTDDVNNVKNLTLKGWGWKDEGFQRTPTKFPPKVSWKKRATRANDSCKTTKQIK